MNRASVPVEERPALLLAAGFVRLMVGLWLDAAIFLGWLSLNELLVFEQEGKAEKAN